MRHTTFRLICLVLLLTQLPIFGLAQIKPDTAIQQPTIALEQGKSVERELKGGETHVFSIQAKANQLLNLVVEQRGIDVVVELFAPDGKKLAEMDSPNGMQGPERVTVVSETGGEFLLKIRSSEKEAAAGRYEAKIETLRDATEQDLHRLAAQKKYLEALALEGKGNAASLRQAIPAFEEALLLWRKAGDRQMEADTLAHLAINNAYLNDVPKGLEYFKQAAVLYRELGKPVEETDMLISVGGIYYTQGDMPKALEYLNQALLLSQSTKDAAGEAGALTAIGGVYDALGQKEKALENYNRAFPLSRASGDRRREAFILNNIGVLYAKSGEMQKALEYLDQAHPLYRAVNARSEESQTLTSIAGIHSDLGDKRKALEYLNLALPLARGVGDRYAESYTLSRIAVNYDALGEKQKALDFYNQALALTRITGDRRGQANILAFLGAFHNSLDERQKALAYYNQVLELVRATGDRRMEAGALTNIGEVYAALNERKEALNYYNQSLALRRTVGDRLGEAGTLAVIGSLYASSGETEKGLDSLNQSLTLRRNIGDRGGEASTLTRMGIVYSQTNDKEKALEYFEQALALWRDVGDRGSEASVLYNIADVYLDRGEFDKGREHIEAAINIVESVRNKFASQDMRTSYSASVQQYYGLYVNLLMQLHKARPADGYAAQALQISERGRARSLLESLSEARADLRQGVDPQLLEREQNLLQILNARAERQARLLSRKGAAEEIAALQKEIAALTAEYQDVQTQIRRNSPRYAALTQPVPLTVGEIQRDLLDADTVLLEYALGEERSFLWVVTKTSLNSYELPKRAEIETAARSVYELLSDGKRWAQSGDINAQYAESAGKLSEMLLSQAAGQLKGKRLVIVSDGALQYIPFGALPVPQELQKTKSAKQKSVNPPLAVEHEIVSLPSASTLAVLRRETSNRKQATKSVAVFADPVFSDSDNRLAAVKINQPKSGEKTAINLNSSRTPLERAFNWRGESSEPLTISRLPFTRREAEAILSVAPTGSWLKALDFKANRETALSKEISDYRIVHFATHGLLHSEHPELSGIVLSLVNEQGAPVDGFLRLNEIYNLDLNSDLVVLSACQTALGKEVRGEGLIGLTRGFMYAGSPRVVASLWKVDDVATAELMKIFYQKMLREKMTASAALRAAKLEMWKQKRWNAPFYWAAFELQGEWR